MSTDTEVKWWQKKDAMYTNNGLNWDYIRDQYARNASPDELASQISHLALKIPGQVKPAKPGGSQPNETSPAMVEKIVSYYQAGNPVSWIVKDTGVGDATVRKILKNRGVYSA